MARNIKLVMALSCVMLLLSGCLYPKEKLEQNQKPAKDAIMSVQLVIDQFQKDTGLLPLINSDVSTPRYEKFKIDFDKLQRMKYLTDIPAAAFEKGGSYYFLIINEETDPTVKLMNLVQFQKVNDIQKTVTGFKDRNGGKLPAGDSYYPGFYLIDYRELNMKEPQILSVFTGQTLPVIMDEQGKVYIDYGADIAKALEKTGSGADNADDLRELLVESSDYVPVKSPAYKLVGGEPQAVQE